MCKNEFGFSIGDMDQFNRVAHVYTSPNFAGVIQDTIRFFNTTPVYSIPPLERFHGTGVYALYCLAKTELYSGYYPINKIVCSIPIYVGKAVPKGWRQARAIPNDNVANFELYNRLRQHAHNLESVDGIDPDEFRCRFMILENQESDLISTVEAALIRQYQPLWNTVVDGFGNHDPGKGRYNQAKSDWDVYYPGRKWAEKCQGKASERHDIAARISLYMEGIARE